MRLSLRLLACRPARLCGSDLQVRHLVRPLHPALAAEEGSLPLSTRSRPRTNFRLIGVFLAAFCAFASTARAEYIVLRSGQRLSVTGYEILGENYRLQIAGGVVMVPTEEVVSIEPEEVFTPNPPKPPVASATGPFSELVAAAAARYGVDAELITSVIAVESNFDPKAISPKNARGLMQLLPETAARLGVKNIFDPQENIEAGTRYLSDLLQRYKNDLPLALAAYNAGPERVEQYGRVPPYAETISYVRRVKRHYDQRKAAPAAKTPAVTFGSAFPVVSGQANAPALSLSPTPPALSVPTSNPAPPTAPAQNPPPPNAPNGSLN